MKILVLGNGFVGKPLAEYLGADTTTLRLNELYQDDLFDYDVVINTAAKTNIDWCDKNRRETFDTNVTQAVRLVELFPGQYVYFSSGCIFKSNDASDIQYEDSIPNPQCFYTYTKLMAEQLLAEVDPEALIIRPRLLISEKPHPRNTIDKLLKYQGVITSQESATVLEDLLPKIKELIEQKRQGAFNICNEGTISPSQIMDIFHHKHDKINKKELDFITVDAGKARRVSTVLGSRRTMYLPPIRDRIQDIYNQWPK